jgi:hypothetical protein
VELVAQRHDRAAMGRLVLVQMRRRVGRLILGALGAAGKENEDGENEDEGTENRSAQ